MKKKTWLIADTHLDHRNIIKYCHRPFKSVDEMNETIVRNWNQVVSSGDCVLFLGDLAFRRFDYWLGKLNGEKVIIRGNHDKQGLVSLRIEVQGHKLLLIHNLAEDDKCGG